MCKPLRRMPNLYKRRVCRPWEEELFFNLLPQSVTCSVKWKIVPSVCALLLPLYRVAISKKRSSKTIVTFTKCVSHAVSSVPLPVLNLNGLPCSLEFRMFNGGRPYMVCQVLWLNLLKLFSSFPKFPKGKFSNSKFTQPIWRTLKARWVGVEVAGPQLRRWGYHKSMQSRAKAQFAQFLPSKDMTEWTERLEGVEEICSKGESQIIEVESALCGLCWHVAKK